MTDRINTQSRPLDVLITALHELHLKIFEMVEVGSNMQLADLKSKPHIRKILRDIIYRIIGTRFYPTTGSEYYKPLQLEKFCVPYHINNNQQKNKEENRITHPTKPAKISHASKNTTKNHIIQM